MELSPKNDSVYYLCFKDKYVNHIQDISSKNNSIKVLSQFNNYEFLIKGRGSFEINDCYISPKYEAKVNGGEMVILPQLVISVKNKQVLASILNKYKDIISVYNNFRSIYELDCKLLSSDDILRLSMEISKMDGVNFCEPNKMLNIVPCNTLYPYQFYLNNATGEDINAENAWNITTGNSDITVAVIDCGVDRNHEDLSANVINGYSVDNPTGYGSPIYPNDDFSHGTACAGIIGAINNTKGIRGVASGVKILPINISIPASFDYGFPIFAAENKIANAIRWAVNNGADVLSCSWGGPNYSANIDSAIVYARTEGRNMKGSVVVCSSGNYQSMYNYVCYPAAMNGVIAVGAVDRDGEICNYSQRGDSLDLVAPSNKYLSIGEIYTTYITGQGNIGNNNYTTSFGGTSAACPQVAGVAALVLSVNPNLTEEQVRAILEATAKDLGSSGFDTTYGYGLVDAYAAVYAALFASTDHEIVGSPLIDTYGQYKIEDLPSGITITWSVSNSYYNNVPQMIPNSPALGWCLLFRDNSHDIKNDTLKAQIKYNGVTVQTLRKIVSAYGDFWGQYTSGGFSGEINYTHTFGVKGNYATTVTSPNFYGATVTYDSSGATPTAWGFNPSLGRLNFVAPASPPGNLIPVVINVHDGCGNDYVLYAFASTANSINVSYEENGITVTLIGDGDSDRGSTFDQPWTVEVRSATTGVLMATESATSRSATISTTGWPKGIYIVKVTIGKEVLTEKVVVK